MIDRHADSAAEVQNPRLERRQRRIGRPALNKDTTVVSGGSAFSATRSSTDSATGSVTISPRGPGRDVLLVDLNNFATFPTLAVGVLVASMRNAGHRVRLMCPLSHDVPAAVREYRESALDDIKRRLHLTTSPMMKTLRNAGRAVHTWRVEKAHPVVIRQTRQELDKKPDVLLLSAYLQHYNTVVEVAKLAAERSIPVLLGGPMFNVPGTAETWRRIPGVTAVVGAESDHTIGAMVDTLCKAGDMLQFPGVVVADGNLSEPAPPMRKLDESPMPDFTDFPWDRYPVRIIPMMTGRGCQWDKCRFCSDVVSVNGRTFRTRSVDNVLHEMQEQARRHDTTSFVFLDLKLNSYPDMIRGVADRIQEIVQGAEWIGTVHVDQRKDNGLSRSDLDAAVKGGMRRISFGLESGSQRLLDLMQKGCTVERNSEFLRNAHEAGLSIRCTMFKGYPGETADDMQQTAEFLEAHSRYLDRVRFNEFSVMEGTPIHESVVSKNGSPIEFIDADSRRAKVNYRTPQGSDRAYQRAKSRALAAVHRINQRELRVSARQFDGIM